MTTADWPYPLWIAHRGAGKLAPENTLAAFRLGASFGFRAFECDVKLSADGIPFLLHDATLERTTSGAGAAAACRWAELSRLDAGRWHGRLYAGEPPPTLEAITAFCRASGYVLNIEIKPSPGRAAETGWIVAREAAQGWAGTSTPPLLSSFSIESLKAARESAPELARALLLDPLPPDWFEQAQALDCVAIVAEHSVMDAAVVTRLHGAGMRALVYTVNDPEDAVRLISLGVDGIVTDAVDRFSSGAGKAA